MRNYARQQTSALLRRLAYQANRAHKGADEDAVHDLRVAIRRLNRCLRVFSQFYPGKSWKKVRRRLKVMMKAAGEVRDRDIAARLLREAGMPAEAAAFRTLEEERAYAARTLLSQVHHWRRQSFSREWRAELGL